MTNSYHIFSVVTGESVSAPVSLPPDLVISKIVLSQLLNFRSASIFHAFKA